MMLSRDEINKLFQKLNQHLNTKGIFGELLLAGGASLALIHNARESTKDIDAVFQPSTEFRQIIIDISEEDNLPSDWLNDGIKGFIDTSKMGTEDYLSLSNLVVKSVDTESLLAMKLVSARENTHDKDDALLLMRKVNITNIDQLYKLVEDRIPKNRHTALANFFIQELWNEYSHELESSENNLDTPDNDRAQAIKAWEQESPNYPSSDHNHNHKK